MAAVGDVYLAASNPRLAAEMNVVGTVSVCTAARDAGVGRVVYASSWEVYGRPVYEPIDENHPCAPKHPYNVTKYAGELMGRALAEQTAMAFVALRLGTAYGTRMRPNSVFSLFVDRARRGEPITIQGTGEQARQFTHARDIGAAFDAALRLGAAGASYNVVADESVSISRLAEIVSGILPTRIEHTPPRPGDVPSARVSNQRVKRELAWEPRVPFEVGVRELVASRFAD